MIPDLATDSTWPRDQNHQDSTKSMSSVSTTEDIHGALDLVS